MSAKKRILEPTYTLKAKEQTFFFFLLLLCFVCVSNNGSTCLPVLFLHLPHFYGLKPKHGSSQITSKNLFPSSAQLGSSTSLRWLPFPSGTLTDPRASSSLIIHLTCELAFSPTATLKPLASPSWALDVVWFWGSNVSSLLPRSVLQSRVRLQAS